MTHPRMYDDGDPVLARLRAVCLALPESVEVEAWGRPTFRAGKKIFAVLGGGQGQPHAMIFKPDPEERPALLADGRFHVPPYFGPAGWLALDLGTGPDDQVEEDELGELVETSYRQVALRRMVRTLDEQAGTDRPGAAR